MKNRPLAPVRPAGLAIKLSVICTVIGEGGEWMRRAVWGQLFWRVKNFAFILKKLNPVGAESRIHQEARLRSGSQVVFKPRFQLSPMDIFV
jgi:hypothetical protein